MNKLTKIIIGIVAGIVLLLVGVALLVPMLVDPNDYKDQITAAVREHTGRELSINGDMELAALPWVGVTINDVILGNAPGFPQPHFARLDSVQVRVKLMPLISKQLEVDTIRVQGLDLMLAKNEAGVTNWDDLAKAGGADKPATNGTDSTTPPVALMGIGGLDLRNAAVQWQDASAGGQVIKVSNIGVQTGNLALGKPVDLTLEFDVEDAVPGLKGHVVTKATVAVDIEKQQHRLSGIEITAELSGGPLGESPAKLAATATEAVFDAGAQTASVKGLKVTTDGVKSGENSVDATLTAEVAADLAKQIFEVTGLALAGTLGGPTKATFDVKGAVTADLGAQTVTAKGLRISVPNLQTADVKGNLTAGADLSGALDKQRFELSGLTVAGLLEGPKLPDGKLPIDLKADLVYDGAAQAIGIAGLTLDAGPMKARSAKLDAKGLGATPIVSGDISLEEFNPRLIAEIAGASLPPMSDGTAMTSASISAKFVTEGETVTLSPLRVVLDGTRLDGKATLTGFEKPAIGFALAVKGTFDVDRYLPPVTAPGAAGTQAAASTPAATAGGGAVALPVDMLRSLDVTGTLKAEGLKVRGVSLSAVDVGLSAKGGVIAVSPIAANLYGGSYSGKLGLDVKGDVAKLSVDENLAGVDLAKLLAAAGVETGVDLAGKSSLAIKTTATGDTAKQVFNFDKLSVTADIAGKTFPQGRLKASLTSDVKLDLGNENVNLSALKLSALDADVTGDLAVKKFASDTTYEGRIAVPGMNPRALLQALGQEPPVTASKKALTSLTLATAVAGTRTSVNLTDLKAKLDDSTLTGFVKISDLATAATEFKLDIDTLDADAYLPPKDESKAAKKDDGKKAKAASTAPDDKTPVLPVEVIKALNVSGTLKIGKLTISGAKLSNVVFTAEARDGILAMKPLGADLYSGKVKGAIRVDASGKNPTIAAENTLEGVQAGPLLKDMNGRKSVSGLMNAKIKLDMAGNTELALRKTMNGDMSFEFKDGEIAGVDFLRTICTAASALNLKSLDAGSLISGLTSAVGGKKKAAGGKDGDDAMKFSALTGSVDVVKGVASNKDLDLKSPLVRVDGAGNYNLVSDRVDYLANTRLVSSCDGQGGKVAGDLANVNIPVKIKGPLAALDYDPDLSGIVAAAGGGKSTGGATAKKATTADKATTAKKKATDTAKKATDNPKEAVKDAAGKALKGLFN